MKKIIYMLLFIALSLVMFGCEKDLYDEKESGIEIEFSVSLIVSNKMNSEQDSMIIENYDELNQIWNDNWGFGSKSFEKFDYENNSILAFSFECNEFAYFSVTEIKREKNTLVVDLYKEKSNDNKIIKRTYFLTVNKEDVDGVTKINVKENQYDYVSITIDSYNGGCLIFEDRVIAIKDKEFDFKHSAIDLETLTVYSGKCKFSKDMELKAYYKDGVYGEYIRKYIFEAIGYDLGVFVPKDDFSSFDYITDENENLIYTKDSITYTFSKSNQLSSSYYLSSIESSKPLFLNNDEETKRILRILYNNDSVFENYYISVKLYENESGYSIFLNEQSIFG